MIATTREQWHRQQVNATYDALDRLVLALRDYDEWIGGAA